MLGVRRAAAIGVVCATIACAASGAHAQQTADESEARRAALYREGTALASAGKWDDAAARFREVIAIRSAPKARIALAVAEENLGHLLDAERTYLAALSEARSAGSSEDESTALVALRVLAVRIPRIALALPAGVTSARVRVDGVTTSLEAGEVAVDPGDHMIAVDVTGQRSIEKPVHANERDRLRLVVTPPASEPEGAAGWRPPLGGLLVAGGGLAAVGVGVVLWAVGKSRQSDLETACPDMQCPASRQAELAPDIQSSHNTIVAGNIVVIVGAVAVAAGAVWLGASFASRPKSAPAAAVARANRTPLRVDTSGLAIAF